ncbi:DUF262 domain-containing protein [Campylobacter corcagiensis]|uniref:DUF262 domain-containing protein n=1 Tax=Campylobacter corcagiensis TaxID=1448857 RepID=A0A7M1LHM0_9BACT|nr:DUF262 domain-containing protein [Campylobacter corcagiensis]QOQ87821.1 DUF262 domain-containing protein [Campylobacter corcagiensis]
MSNCISVELINLKNLLTQDGRIFEIPLFQRPYSWKEEQVNSLLEDIFQEYEKAILNGKIEESDEYFCGSIVLSKQINKKGSNEVFDIIDGQQRLITFTLLASALKDLYSNSNRMNEESRNLLNLTIKSKESKDPYFRIWLNNNHHTDFKSILEQYSASKKEENNYWKNKTFIMQHEFIKEIKDLNIFIKWLYYNIKFNQITCANQNTAIKIFLVLNDRGLKLFPSDILKANLISKTTNKDTKLEITQLGKYFSRTRKNRSKHK